VADRRGRAPKLQWKAIVSLGAICVALVLVGVAQSSWGAHMLRDLGLSASAQPFTELYFEAPAVVAGVTNGSVHNGRRADVAFVIHDSQHRRMTYGWTVQAGYRIMAQGAIVLASGQQATVRRSITIPCGSGASGASLTAGTSERHTRASSSSASSRVRVLVSLNFPKQSISYWVPCHA
jgi:hypothetical protein